jgi:hypothetical protein
VVLFLEGKVSLIKNDSLLINNYESRIQFVQFKRGLSKKDVLLMLEVNQITSITIRIKLCLAA